MPNSTELDMIHSTLREMRDDIKKLSERFTGVAALTSEIKEYRERLHDRFTRINEALSERVLEIEKLEERVRVLENHVGDWLANRKFIVSAAFLIATAFGSLIGTSLQKLLSFFHS
jgi:archaellum component FlaC